LATSWDDSEYTLRVGRAYRRGWRTEVFVPASLRGVTDADDDDAAARAMSSFSHNNRVQLTGSWCARLTNAPMKPNTAQRSRTRSSNLVRGSLLLFLVLSLAPLTFNVRSIVQALSQRRALAVASASGSPMNPRPYADQRAKQYDSAAQEIRMRIEHEQTLYTYQFVIIGAVVGFLIKEVFARDTGRRTMAIGSSITVASGLASVPVLLVDIRIVQNSKMVAQLGTWIHDYYEGDGGWEEFLRHQVGTFNDWGVFPVTLLLPVALTLAAYYYGLLFGSSSTEVEADKSRHKRELGWLLVFPIEALLFCLAFTAYGSSEQQTATCLAIVLGIRVVLVTILFRVPVPPPPTEAPAGQGSSVVSS
jgi:hypothetical protein